MAYNWILINLIFEMITDLEGPPTAQPSTKCWCSPRGEIGSLYVGRVGTGLGSPALQTSHLYQFRYLNEDEN